MILFVSMANGAELAEGTLRPLGNDVKSFGETTFVRLRDHSKFVIEYQLQPFSAQTILAAEKL